jgi:hypothetical protein
MMSEGERERNEGRTRNKREGTMEEKRRDKKEEDNNTTNTNDISKSQQRKSAYS